MARHYILLSDIALSARTRAVWDRDISCVYHRTQILGEEQLPSGPHLLVYEIARRGNGVEFRRADAEEVDQKRGSDASGVAFGADVEVRECG